MLEYLFNKVAGLQGLLQDLPFQCTIQILFPSGKNLKKFHQLSINYVLLKNVTCKVMFIEFKIKSNIKYGAFCKNS